MVVVLRWLLMMVMPAMVLFASVGPGYGSSVIEHTITQSEWPQYANGANLSALPQLRDLLQRFEEREGTRLEIRFPGGEQGNKWARQLQRWFVAYGVPSRYLTLAPGSGAPDRLLVMLVSR